MSGLRRFAARGVFWRRTLRWAVLNIPFWLEPIVMAWWSAAFLLWRAGRRGVMHNVSAILPGSNAAANLFRTYRVFWNFAWTIADNVRFKEQRVAPDWEFVGSEHFEALQSLPGGAIIMTAHMGSYDLAAQLFAENSRRKVVMVRAPEIDPETQAFEERQQDRREGVKIDFNTKAGELALELLHALQHGEIIAVQGDRVTPGLTVLPATLFGRATALPAGPFALAMAARVPIFPLFIIRLGRRRYRVVAYEPIEVIRRGRNRDDDFARAVNEWTARLESVIRGAWWQWFAFDPFDRQEGAA
jgi:predicted LPLAT superfamily acyltransferase